MKCKLLKLWVRFYRDWQDFYKEFSMVIFRHAQSDLFLPSFIFLRNTKEWESENYRVIQDNDGKNYPSDHLPVMVTLSLEK